jgi:hypothetical protein
MACDATPKNILAGEISGQRTVRTVTVVMAFHTMAAFDQHELTL